MSGNVSKNLVLVFIFLLNWLLLKNAFFVAPFGATAAALETGLEIESLKSEQRKILQKREGNYEESDLTRNLLVGHNSESESKLKEDDRGTVNGLTENSAEVSAANVTEKLKEFEDNLDVPQDEPKEKRALREDGNITDDISEGIAKGNMNEEQKEFQDTIKGNEVLETFSEDSESDSVSKTNNDSFAFVDIEEEGLLRDSPHIITPSANFDSLDLDQLAQLQADKRRTHDTLVLKYIEEDLTFDWGDEKVYEWLNFKHQGQDYYIGRRLNDLLMVLPAKEKDLPDTALVVNVGQNITSLETYNYWNFEHHQQEGIIVVATANKIMWFRDNAENQQFELYGNWSQDGYINDIKYYSVSSKDYLVVCSNHTTLEIYNFNLTLKKFRNYQSIQLSIACEEVTLLNSGNEVILVIPQHQQLNVYALTYNELPKFQFKEVLKSQGFHALKAFNVGGRSYLALGGEEAQILVYNQGHFETIFLLDSSFGNVDFFLTIPVRLYYRDDLLLLVQHQSQNLTTTLEVLIWNGETFDNNLPIACRKGTQLQFGVTSCLLDLEVGTRLKGASLLRGTDNVSLIVPYVKGKSRLFHFHCEIMPENAELLELEESFALLQDWVKERDDLIAQAQRFLNTPAEDLSSTPEDEYSLDQLQTPELQFAGEVDDIYLNDYKWSKEDSELDLNYLINSIEDLEKSLSSGRQRRQLDLAPVLYEDLNFDVVMAEELEIENLNGLPFYIQNKVLAFPGEVDFSELEVLDKVVEMKKRQLEEDLELEGDLEFDFINDIKWSDFKKNMVLRTEPQELELLKVEGQVIVEDVLRIKTLNSLAFPEDYLVSNGPRSSIVRAEKYFNNTLSANSVDTDGLINGQNPVEAITLMHSQQWQGSPVFNQLEVSEKLQLHGTAHGRNVGNFPSNPTLQESNIIEAHCVFRELQVNGPIVIKGDLNDKPLGELLKDIIQKPEDPQEEILIPSVKTLGQVIFPIDFQLENNTINQIDTDKFVTIHTPQLLDYKVLDGYVYFYNLSLKGLYDGLKIEEVQKEVISLDKPLDMSTTQLLFEDELQAETLIILNKINDLTIKDNLQTLEEDVQVETAEFEELICKTADFAQNIQGPGKLNNIELHAFVNERSWHEPPVQGNLFLNELYAAQGLQADQLHGLKAEYLLDFFKKTDTLPDMVLNGQIQVDHITVTGDVRVHKLNGLRFDEDLQMNVIWLKRANVVPTKIIFKNPVQIKGNLLVQGNYQSLYMPELLEDVVWKENNSTYFMTAPKSFLRPVYVLQNSQVEAVNGLPFDKIALKTKANVFQGSMKIKGKLLTPELEVQGQVNGHNLKDLQKLIYYDNQLKSFVLKNEIIFENRISVDDLTVQGDFNDLPNLSQFFENLIVRNSRCHLQGNNTFTGRVSIQQGAFIHKLNNLDLQKLFDNLVYIQGPQPVVITSPVVFEDPVKSHKILVNKSLKTKALNGCPLEEWLNDTLRVDQDQYIPHYLPFFPGALDGNSLNVHFINDLDLSRIVTLNTPQEFNESVAFSEVYLRGIIEANGSVNEVNLEEEYNNTLMIYGGQRITTPLTIQSILVLQDLQMLGLVNGNKNLGDVATLSENIELQSPVYFQSLYSPQVKTNDLVTGIDFTKWFETAVRAQGKSTQYVRGNWSTRTLLVKSGPNDFQYPINGFEPWQYNAFIRSIRSYDDEEHEEICQLLRGIWKKIEQKTVEIKRIEEDFIMDLENITSSHTLKEKRKKLFHLKWSKDNFLLFNKDCWSYLYKWNSTGSRFDFLHSYESGPIAQVVVIPSRNSSSLQFITNYESTESLNCSLQGINVWNSNVNKTSHERQVPLEALDVQRSKNALWLLNKDSINELDLSSFEVTEEIKLNFKDPPESTSYRFVAHEGSDDVMVTNGLEIVSLSDQRQMKTKMKKEISFFELPPFFYFPSWLGLPKIETTSYLKPNASMARKFVFSDFAQMLERMLLELSEKLNQQINITQLSIPESDLFDEHLIPDFVSLMEQLQKQKLLSKEMLNITFEEISLPETPAQVLAARVLQIAWPVVEEMEEIHGHVKDNASHHHPLCGNITKSLASLMSDVLREANTAGHQNEAENLFRVIERIRSFDKGLHEMVASLKAVEGEDKLLVSASMRKDRMVMNNTGDSNILNDFYGQEEMLTLEVGAVNNTRHLIAVTKIFTSVSPDQESSIYVYGDNLRSNPYQIITAHKPHSLIQLRLKQETLLMFIESCCQVQVWRYQGTRGFVKFIDFQEDQEIVHLLSMALPQAQGSVKYLLVLLMQRQVKFNKIVVQGISEKPPNLPCA